MDRGTGKLTVFFEEPFWVGTFESVFDGKLRVCKVTFGAEPKEYDIQSFILKNYSRLIFSPPVDTDMKESAGNPKRMQREAKRQMQCTGIGTKSQRALQLQHEEMKTLRKQISREKREEEEQRKFELKQQKKKEKHKGR